MKKLNYLFLILFVIDLSCSVGIRAGAGGNTRNLHLLPSWFLLVLFLSCSPISSADICWDSCSCIEASFLCLRPWKRFFSS